MDPSATRMLSVVIGTFILACQGLPMKAHAFSMLHPIAECRGVRVDAEINLDTEALKVYVDRGDPAQNIAYDRYALQKDAAGKLLTVHQKDLPITSLDSSRRIIIVAPKEGAARTFSKCRFDTAGIDRLKKAPHHYLWGHATSDEEGRIPQFDPTLAKICEPEVHLTCEMPPTPKFSNCRRLKAIGRSLQEGLERRDALPEARIELGLVHPGEIHDGSKFPPYDVFVSTRGKDDSDPDFKKKIVKILSAEIFSKQADGYPRRILIFGLD